VSRRAGNPVLAILALFGVGAGAIYLFRKEVKAALPSPSPWWALAPLAPALAPLSPILAVPWFASEVARSGRNSIVLQVQAKLGVPLTGEDDATTKAAVGAFQRAHGLTVDGIIGPQTLGALGIRVAQTIVPRSTYKPTLDEAAQALANAYQRVTGSTPSAPVLSLLMAQSSWETRSGPTGWNLPNFNWGGIKASVWDPLIQVFSTKEGYGASEVTVPKARFVAYRSIAEGAEDYIRRLKGRAAWWAGLQSGTPDGLLRGLTSGPAGTHYFTGNPQVYLTGLRSLVNTYAPTAARYV
jgi:Putative peptidoglycan binding domain